jgi:hypothetical protein
MSYIRQSGPQPNVIRHFYINTFFTLNCSEPKLCIEMTLKYGDHTRFFQEGSITRDSSGRVHHTTSLAKLQHTILYEACPPHHFT